MSKCTTSERKQYTLMGIIGKSLLDRLIATPPLVLPSPLAHALLHLTGVAPEFGEVALLGSFASIERGIEVDGSGGTTSSCETLKGVGNRDPDSGRAIEYRVTVVVAVCGMS